MTRARYALRYETIDGTLEEPWHYITSKLDAMSAAKRAAKDCSCDDVVRVWVDDTKTELGVYAFEVSR